jgi:hypothetical protein
MTRYNLKAIREHELQELKYLEKWYFLMSGFTRSRWAGNPENKKKIERLKELRQKYLFDIIGVR